MLLQKTNGHEGTIPSYAISGDFCRIFAEDMNRLYLLSFLLTGDRQKAEQCFVSGLEDCTGASRVFKDWARSWARRTVIQNAVRVMRPAHDSREQEGRHLIQLAEPGKTDDHVPFAEVISLPTFERFVFVMTVLEQYSDHDSAALLGCSRQDVVRARVRALEAMAPEKEWRSPRETFNLGVLFAQAGWLAKTA